MTLSRGIDVSHHQGVVDWRRLKAEQGLTWGACKATEGTTFRDSQFARNWANLKAAGLVRMAYHFARPSSSSSAAAQARWFLSVVRPIAGDVLCLDLEESKLDQARTNRWARSFGQYLRDHAPGCTTVVYLGGYSRNGSGLGLSAWFDYWWYPRYPSTKPTTRWPSFNPVLEANRTGWPVPHIWQWSYTHRTSEGLVDANVSTLTAKQLRDGPAAPAKPSPQPTPKPTPKPSPAPTGNGTVITPGGPDVMPDNLRTSWTGRQPLTAGKWRTALMATSKGAGTPSILEGAQAATGRAGLYFTGGKPGDTIQIRPWLFEYDAKAKAWTPARSLGISEHQVTAGTTFVERQLTCHAAKGQRLRVLVLAPAGVELVKSYTDLLTWKA